MYQRANNSPCSDLTGAPHLDGVRDLAVAETNATAVAQERRFM
jgi:hypothetical protein